LTAHAVSGLMFGCALGRYTGQRFMIVYAQASVFFIRTQLKGF
jgi:hypothetical protein